MRSLGWLLGMALAMPSVALPVAAWAHDVSYELRGAGHVRVGFRYQDGTPMAGAAASIFAPGSDTLPDVTGVTDAAGEVRVTAGRDGVWRIDVRDAEGHSSRARVAVKNGVPAIRGEAFPEWVAWSSLSANVVLVSLWAFSRRRPPAARAQPAPANALNVISV